MIAVTDEGQPWETDVASGGRGEVYAIKPVVKQLPAGVEVSGDRIYDVPWFRIWLMHLGFRANIPYRACWYEHLKIRKPGKPADNPLTYAGRWKVERALAWFGKFKRLNIRYEYYDHLYQAFWDLATASLLLHHILG